MNCRLIVDIHPQDHDEAKVCVEDVSTEENWEQFHPIDHRLLVNVTHGSNEISCVDLCAILTDLRRMNHHEIELTVDREREENGEDKQRDQMDQNFEWSYWQPATDFDHLEVSFDFISVVVIWHFCCWLFAGCELFDEFYLLMCLHSLNWLHWAHMNCLKWTKSLY